MKVTDTELVQRENFFTESQPILCSMKGVSIRNLGKMLHGMYHSNMPTLHWGSTDLLQAKFAWKANHILTQHQDRNSAALRRAQLHKWGRGWDIWLRSQVCNTRQSWVAPTEAKGGEMLEPEHLLESHVNPTLPGPSGSQEPRILKSRGCLSEFLQQICSDVGPQSR